MTSRLEIGFQRLLSSTETLAADQGNLKGLQFRRLQTYVGELRSKLTELQKSKTCETDVIAGYSKRLSFLLNLIDSEASSEVPCLSGGFDCASPSVPSSIRQRVIHQKSIPSANASPASSFVLKQSTPGSAKETEIKLKVTSRHERDVQQELFRMHKDEEKLHHEQKPDAFTDQEDVEVILKRHNEMQEQLAEDMIRIAKNMKEHQLTAKKIITDDNEKLVESSNLAARNYDRLKTETERVQVHTRSCSCWIWLMLVIVCVVFIFMILFIRIIPKR